MNKPNVNQYLTQSASPCCSLSLWPENLMAQHKQLHIEIEAIHTMLSQPICRLLQLDARLKKLIKGVITHLELESCFLAPVLKTDIISVRKKNSLNQGFQDLYKTCHATTDYIQALKLALGNSTIESKHSVHISQFLTDIMNRLNDEDVIYSIMNNKRDV